MSENLDEIDILEIVYEMNEHKYHDETFMDIKIILLAIIISILGFWSVYLR